jgi:hypothetical protein
LSQTRDEGLVFKHVKGHEDDEEQRVVKVPEDTLVKLEAHRKRQDEFRAQFGADYAAGKVTHQENSNLIFGAERDLIFTNPDGTPLKPHSVCSTVSHLFKRLKIQNRRAYLSTCCGTRSLRRCWMAVYRSLLFQRAWATPQSGRPPRSTRTQSTEQRTTPFRSGRNTSSGTGRREASPAEPNHRTFQATGNVVAFFWPEVGGLRWSPILCKRLSYW